MILIIFIINFIFFFNSIINILKKEANMVNLYILKFVYLEDQLNTGISDPSPSPADLMILNEENSNTLKKINFFIFSYYIVPTIS